MARTRREQVAAEAVRAPQCWKESGWPACNGALRRIQYPAQESPDSLIDNLFPSSSGHFAENIQNVSKSFPGVFLFSGSFVVQISEFWPEFWSSSETRPELLPEIPVWAGSSGGAV